jgi:argininosuccinate lyase
MNSKKLLDLADFLDNPEQATFSKLMKIEEQAVQNNEAIKSINETNKENLLEVLSSITEKIDNIEKPETKDYDDCLERIEKKLNEPNEIEVTLDII